MQFISIVAFCVIYLGTFTEQNVVYNNVEFPILYIDCLNQYKLI